MVPYSLSFGILNVCLSYATFEMKVYFCYEWCWESISFQKCSYSEKENAKVQFSFSYCYECQNH